jgi:hypothetical protein
MDNELAKRAINCKGWRWMPGMRYSTDSWRRDGFDRVPDDMEGAAFADWLDRGRLPDLEDPATLGCLLALVREAWDRPTAFLYWYGGRWFFDPQQFDPTDHPSGRTEAETLVAALEVSDD